MTTMVTQDVALRKPAPIELPLCSFATTTPSPNVYGTIVNIIVGDGPTKRQFQVYEGLLTHYSAHFRTALNGRWSAGPLKTVNLLADDPNVFEAVFHWLLTRKLYSSLTPEGEIPLTFRTISSIYIFGDARSMPELCNTAIDLIFQWYCQQWLFTSQDVGFIYSNTCEKSALRRLLTRMAAETFIYINLKLNEPHYSKEFLIDVLIHYQNIKNFMGTVD